MTREERRRRITADGNITGQHVGLLAVGRDSSRLRLVVIRGVRRTSVRTIVDAIDLWFVTSELIEAEKTQARQTIQSDNGYWCRVARQYPIVRNRS